MRRIIFFAMMKRLLVLVVVASCLSFSCSSERAALPAGSLTALLPGDEVSGWERDGAPEEYEGEDLYAYINGGAEIYHEYGFRRVVLQDYRDGEGRSVSLEIFEMGTPAAAFGMFSFKRSGKGRPASMGDEAELESYYLNFWKDRFVVTLTGFDESRETVEGLLALGAAVDARIREKGERPALVGALPEKGLDPGSVKFIRGLLGLNSIYSFHTARGLLFEQGVVGLYENGATLLILDYGSKEKAGGSRAQLEDHLMSSDRFTGIDKDESGLFLVRDGKGRALCLTASGAHLLVAIGPDPSACLEIVGRAL